MSQLRSLPRREIYSETYVSGPILDANQPENILRISSVIKRLPRRLPNNSMSCIIGYHVFAAYFFQTVIRTR